MLQKPSNLNVSGADLLCNTRVKRYPNGQADVLVCDRDIFRPEGWEAARPAKKSPRRGRPGESSERSMRRARAQLRDIALCTPFRWFVTLTLDGAQVDRYDMHAVTRKLTAWCDNQVRRHGLAYVLVPERHKDGAIHFHGFFNDALPVADSGTVSLPGAKRPRRPRSAAQRALWLEQGGHVVYNLPGWSLGFTTAIELYGQYDRAVGYVCKYIGKDGEKVGGRWYYSGGDLRRPVVSYCDFPIREAAQAANAYQFTVKDAGLSFVILKGEWDDERIGWTDPAVQAGGAGRGCKLVRAAALEDRESRGCKATDGLVAALERSAQGGR